MVTHLYQHIKVLIDGPFDAVPPERALLVGLAHCELPQPGCVQRPVSAARPGGNKG